MGDATWLRGKVERSDRLWRHYLANGPGGLARHFGARARFFDGCAEAAERCGTRARVSESQADARSTCVQGADRGNLGLEVVRPAASEAPSGLVPGVGGQAT
jgi:hypothetical protein